MVPTHPVGFCSSPRFVEHEPTKAHPERPDRIRAIHRAVRLAGLVTSPNPFPDFQIDLGLSPVVGGPTVVELTPTPADESHLRLVHPQAMIDRVRHVSSLGGVLDQGDTPTEKRSYATALLAVGAGLTAADAVMAGTVGRAFAAGRPPGHHAEPDRAMGFCLFSNIAVVARHLQRNHGVGRVAIVDFDVHHGNGTQAAFEADPSVLFVSLHQDPRTCYPGSGYAYETGTGPGEGYTLNVPFPPGAGDAEYAAAMDRQVVPAVDAFRPEVLLISAGFDAHHDDPLAQVELSDASYESMTRTLAQVADRHCGGRVVSLLEGGYNLRALGRGVVRHLIGLG